jgi:hypothetical protein
MGHLTMYIHYTFIRHRDTLIMVFSIITLSIMTHSITTLCIMKLSILTLSMTVKASDVMLAVVIKILQRASSGQR